LFQKDNAETASIAEIKTL